MTMSTNLPHTPSINLGNKLIPSTLQSPNGPQEQLYAENLESLRFACRSAYTFQQEKEYQTALQEYRSILTIIAEYTHHAPFAKELKSLMADVLFEIGQIHFDTQDLFKALEAFGCCLDLQQEALPWNDTRIATTLENMAQIYSRMNDPEKTIDLLVEAVAVLSESGDSVHLKSTWQALGQAQLLQGLEEDAESSFFEADHL